jgi:Ala-tRNA(Pro) deacylase
MALALSVERYLIKSGIRYGVMSHHPTKFSMATVHAAGIPARRLAKSVVLRDELGYLIAVVPASHRLRLGSLHVQLRRPLGLATESELRSLFNDCAVGAIPPLGQVYGLEVIVDDILIMQPEVYFEGGDHQELIQVAGADFRRLLPDAMHGRFSFLSLEEASPFH